MVVINIDTSKDSKEELKEVVKLLLSIIGDKAFLKELSPSTITNYDGSPSSYSSNTASSSSSNNQSFDEGIAAFNIFNDDSSLSNNSSSENNSSSSSPSFSSSSLNNSSSDSSQDTSSPSAQELLELLSNEDTEVEVEVDDSPEIEIIEYE